MSAIGWVDFSSEHREKVKSVIDLLSTPGVIDELGIGVIRDSFSDSLFPGISTIQTRAKYLVTVPRIFLDYRKLNPSQRRRRKLVEFLNDHENQCMEAMVNNHENDRQNGIIGESFAEKAGEVLRKPSSVYWTGLRQFGLVRTNQSLRQFCSRYANPDQPIQDLVKGNAHNESDDPDAADPTDETVVTPSYGDNWITSLTIHLSQSEAAFLSHQIEARVPKSLLGQILLDADVRQQFISLANDWNFTTFADNAPFIEQFPNDLQRIIIGARDFWQLIHGAHIRYNCLLQMKPGAGAKQDEFDAKWEAWRSELNGFSWDRWETGFLWYLAKLHRRKVQNHTIQFVEDWIAAIRSGHSDLQRLNELVERQEIRNKTPRRARLHPSSDERPKKWVGIGDLNYRLSEARTIITDIHDGLLREEADGA